MSWILIYIWGSRRSCIWKCWLLVVWRGCLRSGRISEMRELITRIILNSQLVSFIWRMQIIKIWWNSLNKWYRRWCFRLQVDLKLSIIRLGRRIKYKSISLLLGLGYRWLKSCKKYWRCKSQEISRRNKHETCSRVWYKNTRSIVMSLKQQRGCLIN